MDDFKTYLKHLISTNQIDGCIPEEYKPIVIAHLFNAEVFRSGIQSFFELFPFSLKEVVDSLQILKVASSLVQVVKDAQEIEYISDDELYEQAPDDEERYEELMEERDLFWDDINGKYRSVSENDVDEKIAAYIQAFGLEFKID